MMSEIFFGCFDPHPYCLHLDLIYTAKFTQPPLLRLPFHEPSSDGDIISGSSLRSSSLPSTRLRVVSERKPASYAHKLHILVVGWSAGLRGVER